MTYRVSIAIIEKKIAEGAWPRMTISWSFLVVIFNFVLLVGMGVLMVLAIKALLIYIRKNS